MSLINFYFQDLHPALFTLLPNVQELQDLVYSFPFSDSYQLEGPDPTRPVIVHSTVCMFYY